MADPIIKELQVEQTSAPMILVIGQTGAGKSHFINKLVGSKVVKESARLYSCTSKPELVEATVDQNDFLLVDTPGFNDSWRDSDRSDAKILSEIARTLTLQSQLGVHLRGILYLFDITAKRMTGDMVRQLQMIKLVCGENNYGNVILVTTHWPKHIDEQKERGCPIREADLRKDFWKEMIKGGSKMFRFDDTQGTAKAIIRSLAGKQDITLRLQDEMAKGKPLSGTTAGSFIVDARHSDESALQTKLQLLAKDPSNSRLRDEVAEMQTSVEFRKAAESRSACPMYSDLADTSLTLLTIAISDDLVARIRNEIQTVDEEARRRKHKPTVANILRWLLGISQLTMDILQVAL